MKMLKKRFAAAMLFAACASIIPVMAETVTITQVDASPLLLSQTVDLYLSVTDNEGQPVRGLGQDAFSVSESADGDSFSAPLEIESLRESPHEEEGIHILLLVDNSGSMYDTLSGKPTEDVSQMRTTHARRAIGGFVGSSFNPGDRIALASFNTMVTIHSESVTDPASLNSLLKEIRRPESDRAYTELYHALIESVEPVGSRRGRRVVVVLSDGENYPYHTHRGEPHPVYGTALRNPDEVVEEYQREGVSLYAINFGSDRDRNLGDMALQTGGSVYDARNEEELTGIYQDIRRKIDSEYRLRYRAGMSASDRTFVKVVVDDGQGRGEATRFYYTSTMFGIPVVPYPWGILLLVPAAALVWLLLLLLRYRRFHQSAALQVLQTGYGTRVSSATVALTGDVTVIGGGDRADLTISGRGAPREQEVTVMFDKNTGSYTLAGGAWVTVNNQPLKSGRRLSGGDVLNIEGTTIVFEEPDRKKSEEQG